MAEDGSHIGKRLTATPFQRQEYPDSECSVLWELDEWLKTKTTPPKKNIKKGLFASW